MKKIVNILLIIISLFIFTKKVNAIKCSYKIDTNCNVVISESGQNSISKVIEGNGTKCNSLHFSFDINENNFFYNGTFQCAKLYQSSFTTQARDTGYKLSTGDRYNYQHGNGVNNPQITVIEDEEVGAGEDFIPGQANDKYAGIETCTDVDVNYIKACGCIPAEVADITSKVYFILRLLGPIILLIIGSFDMAKAVVTQDEKSIAKAQKKLVNKFVAAAAIFLVLTIIKFAVGIVADDVSGIFKCIDILLDGYVI